MLFTNILRGQLKKAVATFSVVTLLVSLCAPLASVAVTSLSFSDGFESSPDHYLYWTSHDSKWGTNSSGVHSGAFSAEVKGDTDGFDHLVKLIPTTGNQNITLSFWYKANNLESGDSDRVEVWYTTNNGAAWTEVASLQVDDDNDDNFWHQSNHTFATSTENKANFGFRFSAHLDNASDKVWIDDVSLTGSIIVVDTDGDGIADWEEALWGTDKNKKITFNDTPDATYIENKKKELKDLLYLAVSFCKYCI